MTVTDKDITVKNYFRCLNTAMPGFFEGMGWNAIGNLFLGLDGYQSGNFESLAFSVHDFLSGKWNFKDIGFGLSTIADNAAKLGLSTGKITPGAQNMLGFAVDTFQGHNGPDSLLKNGLNHLMQSSVIGALRDDGVSDSQSAYQGGLQLNTGLGEIKRAVQVFRGISKGDYTDCPDLTGHPASNLFFGIVDTLKALGR